jgi:hypothetical protein
MSVNGLREEFDKVVYRSDLGGGEGDSGEFVEGTLVQRSTNGTIKANDPIEDKDVINQISFNTWVEEVVLTEDDIDKLY